MKEPSKAELLATVAELTSTVQRMHSEYANDRSLGRAVAMKALKEHGEKIGHGCLARFDYDYLESAVETFTFDEVDTASMRAA